MLASLQFKLKIISQFQMDPIQNQNISDVEDEEPKIDLRDEDGDESISVHEQQSSNPNNIIRGCNCKKSKCQKMYCECYLAGTKCTDNCRCINCQNMTLYDSQGNRIDNDEEMESFRKAKNQPKSCNCKKSECLKKYCECFNAGMACNSLCKCEECKNITNGETSQPFHNSIDTVQVNITKMKNKQFNEKLEGVMSMIAPSQKQSMLEFVYYLLS